jgi:hypothetical protein
MKNFMSNEPLWQTTLEFIHDIMSIVKLNEVLYGASLGGKKCNTSKTWVQQVSGRESSSCTGGRSFSLVAGPGFSMEKVSTRVQEGAVGFPAEYPAALPYRIRSPRKDWVKLIFSNITVYE